MNTHKSIGPINLTSLGVFLFHLALCIGSFLATKTVRAPASTIAWLPFSYAQLIVAIPLIIVLCFSFLFAFANSSGFANMRAWGLSILIGAIYAFFAYIIQAESPEPFFWPAMMLLPILYAVIYLISFFSLWLSEG